MGNPPGLVIWPIDSNVLRARLESAPILGTSQRSGQEGVRDYNRSFDSPFGDVHSFDARRRINNRISECARSVVRGFEQAILQSTGLDICAGLDCALRFDRHCRVEDMGACTRKCGHDLVVCPAKSEFLVVSSVLFSQQARDSSGHCRRNVRYHHGFHSPAVVER